MNRIFQSKKRLIIFDADDTLLTSHIDYQQLRLEVINLIEYEHKNSLIKKSISELLKILEDESPKKANEAINKIKELEAKFADKAEIIPFADSIHKTLDKYGLFYAILTNNTRASMSNYIKNPTFSFLNYFFILTRDEAKMKPNPDGIIKIIKNFKNHKIAKEETLYIGDSFIDANACYHAGIDFVHFHSRDVDLSQFIKKPSYTMKSWKNFETFLEKVI